MSKACQGQGHVCGGGMPEGVHAPSTLISVSDIILAIKVFFRGVLLTDSAGSVYSKPGLFLVTAKNGSDPKSSRASARKPSDHGGRPP